MSTLHDALAAFKDQVQAATQFADGGAHIAAKEMEFKQAVADAHAALEERVAGLEQQLAALTTPAGGPPAEPPADEKPAADAPV